MRMSKLILLAGAVLWTTVLCADELRLNDLKARLASPDSKTRFAAATDLLNLGKARPLKKEEIDLVLPHLEADPDWTIKVRVCEILPYAENPHWVIGPLIEALKDTQAGGEGNVPGWSCRALGRVGDESALKPMREWLQFLETHPGVYGTNRDDWIRGTKKWIAELEARLKMVK